MDAQCFTDPKSTLMASSCDDLASLAPHGPAAAHGADEAKLSQLLAMRVDLGSVKHHTAAVDYDNGSAVFYRSQIDDLDAEISHYYRLSAGGGGRTHAQNTSWKVAPFDEIAVYRSDPRHVTKLMSRSGGLGVVITLVRGAMGSFCGA
jgi:hypothetical protein